MECKYGQTMLELCDRKNRVAKQKLHPRRGDVVDEQIEMLEQYEQMAEQGQRCGKLGEDLLFNLGCAYEYAGDLEKSIETHQKLIEQKPNDHEALYTAGTNLCKLERFGEALPLLEKAVGLNPHNANYRQNLGYARRGGPEVTRTRSGPPMKHPRLGWGPIC